MKRIVLHGGRWQEGDQEGAAWIRAGGVDAGVLEGLGKTHGLHPLAREDVGNPRQRPKVEDYDDHTFITLRIPRGPDPDEGWQQVGIWILADAVITASPSPIPELDVVEAHMLRQPGWAPDAPMVGYRIIDALVDSWFPFMNALEDEAEQAEDAAVDRPDKEVLAEIRRVKQTVGQVRKLLGPMREAMVSLERNNHVNIPASLQVYLRDISDHTIRLAERLEHVREMALIAQESWNAALANHQNQVMKRLTVVAGLLLVPSLLAGLGGMNFDGGPDWRFWPVTGVIFGIIAVGLSLSIWRRWL